MMKDEDIEIPVTSERKLRSIVSSLRRRTLRLKSVVEQPPTPTDQSEEEEEDDKQELILEDFTESRYASKLSLVDPEQRDIGFRAKLRVSGYIDPRGNLYIGQVELIMTASSLFLPYFRMVGSGYIMFYLQRVGNSSQTILQTLSNTRTSQSLAIFGLFV
mgnify:FL=1